MVSQSVVLLHRALGGITFMNHISLARLARETRWGFQRHAVSSSDILLSLNL